MMRRMTYPSFPPLLRVPRAIAALLGFHAFAPVFTVFFALVFTLGAILSATPAAANSDGQFDPENVAQVDLLPGWRMADGRHMAALRIRLADGWKTYWRAPGETGIPPAFDWSGSKNVAGVQILWPVPGVFDTAGARTLGYKHELILPIAITPRRDGRKITVRGRVALGVCSDVCLPMEAKFSAVLPTSGEDDSAVLIRKSLARLPKPGAAAGLGAITCEVEPISDGLRVTARLTLPKVGVDEIGVIEPADQTIWVSPTELTRNGNTLTLVSELVPPSARPFLLSRSDIRISVFGGGNGVDIASCVGS